MPAATAYALHFGHSHHLGYNTNSFASLMEDQKPRLIAPKNFQGVSSTCQTEYLQK